MIRIDDSLTQALERLRPDAVGRILTDALKKGADVLRDLARTGAESCGYKVTPRMRKGIKSIRDKGLNLAVVSIMGDYRLKWYEKGTVDRVTKSGHRTGRVTPKYFFRNARQDEAAITGAVFRELDRQIKNL